MHSRSHSWRDWRGIFAAAVLTALTGAEPALAQKTDTVAIIRGSHVIGEVKGLRGGKLELSTWAMSTVYVEWTKVSTVTTDKVFEIDLSDGRRFFGSLRAVGAPNEVAVIAGTDTLQVPTQSVVALSRVKPTFWDGLDGSIDMGIDFTQQNAKTDFNLSLAVRYKAGLRNFRLNSNITFSRQDSADNISSSSTDFTYAKETKNRWFYGGLLAAQQNSQLDLDLRATLGAGVGRFLVQTNKVALGLWTGLSYSLEQYTGETGQGTVPAFFTADFLYFVWGALDKELSGRLTVMPVLGSNRWRVQFNSNLKWEIARHLYFKLGLNEYYDSNPPSEDANKNDLSVTSSVGWSF